MRNKIRPWLIRQRGGHGLLLAVSLVIVTFWTAGATAGTMTDLDPLAVGWSNGRDINDSGQGVGFFISASGADHAFLYSGGSRTDLGTLGGTDSYAYGINNSGQGVGKSATASGAEHAFLYSGGSMTDLGTLGGTDSYAYGINDLGQVVGESYTTSGAYHAFLYAGGAMTDLGTLGGTDSYAYGINDLGQVVGASATASGAYHAFLYAGGTMTDLGTLGGTNSHAYGINDLGQVVGDSDTASSGGHAFLYSADVGAYSRYDFTFNYNNGSGDYYTGYVYAPTSFETSQGGFLSVGTYLYDQPMELWASGYQSINGGYYYITAITDGFASTYDKKSYITAYYDADTAQSSLALNSDGSATAANIYVADRTASMEMGYAISGANHAIFSPYVEADVTTTGVSSALLSAASLAPSTSSSISAPQSQAVWAAYWSQTSNLLEQEK